MGDAFKHRVEIYKRVNQDGSDSPKPIADWTLITSVWASYRDVSGKEFFASHQAGVKISGEFKIRYRSDLKQTYYILYGSRLFNIIAITDIEDQKRYLWIKAEEVFDYE
jgi:SPP1 family predicted phage head-tail adaptor